MSFFSSIPQEPEDPIYGLQVVFKNDPRPDKLNLSIGVLPGKKGAMRFQAIEKAAQKVQENGPGFEYLPIDGLVDFREAATELIFGTKVNIYTAQTVGGTAALCVGAQLLRSQLTSKIAIPDPTWVNHRRLFEAHGLHVTSFAYHAAPDGSLDTTSYLASLDRLQERSCVVLQASCHNPTGLDPTMDQWKMLLSKIQQKKLIPFFDIAYQGVGLGIEEDAAAIRLFYEAGCEMLVASSFSKNFGLYGERVGTLSVVTKSPLQPLSSQIRKIIRSLYSSPAAHGARLAAMCLKEPALFGLWKDEIEMTQCQIKEKRKLLASSLQQKGLHTMATNVLKSTGESIRHRSQSAKENLKIFLQIRLQKKQKIKTRIL